MKRVLTAYQHTTVIAGGIGIGFGAAHGMSETRWHSDPFLENVSRVSRYMLAGGIFFGVAWPVIVPVYVYTSFEQEK